MLPWEITQCVAMGDHTVRYHGCVTVHGRSHSVLPWDITQCVAMGDHTVYYYERVAYPLPTFGGSNMSNISVCY